MTLGHQCTGLDPAGAQGQLFYDAVSAGRRWATLPHFTPIPEDAYALRYLSERDETFAEVVAEGMRGANPLDPLPHARGEA